MITFKKYAIILVWFFCSIFYDKFAQSSSEGMVSFIAADERTIYKAILFEAGAANTAVDMGWSPIVAANASSNALLTDFDFDATRHRLVFANSDPAMHTVSVSECYLLRPNEDQLSCVLTTSLIYRQINVTSNSVFVALDWLTGDTYILLPGLFVRCSLPSAQFPLSSDCIETKIRDTINPSIVRLDPFSRSLIWNQKRSYKSGRQPYCQGINRVSLTQQTPFLESTCLLNDATITSIFVNHTSGAIIFTNSSRESIFQLDDSSSVTVVRRFANEGYADSVVNCPAPVRSLTHFEETDVFFWTAPDVRKRPIRTEFSQILAFEVDGLCSSHPTSKDLSRVTILQPMPRLDDSFLKSTLTEQIRCYCTPASNFTLQITCKWAYSSSIITNPIFFLVEIGGQLSYRTMTPSFNAVLTKKQLVDDLKMSDAVALHITIRVCSKWHCALPANVYIQQSPFTPTSIQVYRAFTNVLPSFSVSVRWHLPNLFQAVTSVTLTPDTAPDTFYHQSTIQEEMVFEHLSTTSRYVAKLETCNIWNCSETSKIAFKPDDLKFEPVLLCWKNSTPSLTISSTFYQSRQQNLSNSVIQTGSTGVQSAVYLLSTKGNASVAWIDVEKGRIFSTSLSGETRLIVDAPITGIRRHSLTTDFLTSRLFWIESDILPGRSGSSELHSTNMIRDAFNPNQQHFSYALPNDQSWTRLVVNSTSGVLFVLSGDVTTPSGALVFDLLSNKIVTNLESEVATSVDHILTLEKNDLPQDCQHIFDENAISLYDNRVCFDFSLNKTDFAIKNATTPNSISISLLNVTNELCLAKSALRRFVIQSATFYISFGNNNVFPSSCLHRDKTIYCQHRKLIAENGTTVFTGLPAFTDYQLFAEMILPIFNQSRVLHLGRIRTQPAVPNEPRQFRCGYVTPEEIVLEWQPPVAFNGPVDQIEYILKWQEPSEQDQKKLVGRSMEVDGSKPVVVTHLQPDWLYEFRLVARSRLFPSTETSQPVFARCRTSSVGKISITPVVLERSKLVARFHPAFFSSSKSLATATIVYGPASELHSCLTVNEFNNKALHKLLQLCSGSNCSQPEPIVKLINDLQPKTFYRFCLVLNYQNGGAVSTYIYPQYFQLVVETGGFKLEAPRVWTSFAGVEVLLFASGDPPKVLQSPLKSKHYTGTINNNNEIGDYQLLYSDDDTTFCQQQSVNFSQRVFTRNVTSSGRTIMAFHKENFEVDRPYWFRLSLSVDDQFWLSDCSDPVTVHSNSDTSTVALALVGRSGLVAATGLIALISCVSVVAFCLSLFAFVFLFRRANSHLSSAKMFVGRYFCRLLDYSGLTNTLRNNQRRGAYRFEFNNFSNHHFVGVPGGANCSAIDHRSRSTTASGNDLILPTVYSPSQQLQQQTMTLMNAGRGRPATGGLWSLSTLSPDTSPVTATSSTGPGGAGPGSVFSFDCDGTMQNSISKGTFPLRFMTLANQIYGTPAGITNWLQQLPQNVLRLNREQIQISRFLGAGAFGEVYEGEIALVNETNKQIVTTQVAVKTLKPDADSDRRASFCREAALMSHFNHPNIVRLIGMCIAPSPHCATLASANNVTLSVWPLMVLELMNGGDLLGYLRRARQATEKSLSTSSSSTKIHKIASNSPPEDPNCLKMVDLFDICIDVASGCRYLEKKRFCHRDIAARNCLVSCSNDPGSPRRRVVKIGDFGLARTLDGSAECYRKVGEGLMPVRWMSPESLNDGIFTTQSDIWSFGVLMYEVFSLGRQPYAGRANHEVFEMVKTGSHPECPRDCPTAVCRLMLSCFQIQPENRPSFKTLLCDLKSIRTTAILNNRRNLTVEKSRSSSNLPSFTCLKTNEASFAISMPAYATLARQKPLSGHSYQLPFRPGYAKYSQTLIPRLPMRSDTDAPVGSKNALNRRLSTSSLAIAKPLAHKTVVPIIDDSNNGCSISNKSTNKTTSNSNLNDSISSNDSHQQVKIKVSENVGKQLLSMASKSSTVNSRHYQHSLRTVSKPAADITIVSHVHPQRFNGSNDSLNNNNIESVFI